MSSFVTQGAVPLGSDAYEPRGFENAVFEEVIAGGWVLLLGPRQHGKTTGLIRIADRLTRAGFKVGSVDLQGLPPQLSYPDLLDWVTGQLAASIETIKPLVENGGGDFLRYLEALFPADGAPIVIVIDEAANIRDADYRNSFFGQIRQISNLRASKTASHIPLKVRFVFAGTFRPEQLVFDEFNSPFNVCKTIDTDDLSLQQALALAERVESEIAHFVEPLFGFVGGQPYLLQTAFETAMAYRNASAEEMFCHVTEALPQLVRAHLESIFRKVARDPVVAKKVGQMVERGSTPLVPADDDCSFLQVLGIAKRDGRKLVFRNQLYREVAENNPNIRERQGESDEIVLLLHGIRTDAHWAEMVRKNLEDPPRLTVIPIRYGFMDLFQFLRSAKVRERIIRDIHVSFQEARANHPKSKISVIAHSFGRIVLCGSILPTQFPWYQLGDRAPAIILNECGSKDIWPTIAASLCSEYGPSGTFGFASPRIRNRFHKYSHSAYFSAEFVQTFWRPYFLKGAVVETDWEISRPAAPWLLQILPRFGLLLAGFIVVCIALLAMKFLALLARLL